jgi:hypothetical protein
MAGPSVDAEQITARRGSWEPTSPLLISAACRDRLSIRRAKQLDAGIAGHASIVEKCVHFQVLTGQTNFRAEIVSSCHAR